MRIKIRTKIVATTALVVSLSLLFSGYFTYNYASDIIREQSIKDSSTKLAQISFQLKKVQEQTVKTAEYIVSDEEIAALIANRPGDSLEQAYFRKLNVQDKLKRFTALNAFILNVVILRDDGEVFSNNSGYEEYFTEYLQQPWFENLKDEKTSFSDSHSFFYVNRNRPVFSYVIKYRPPGGSAGVSAFNNYLVLDVDQAEIDNAFKASDGDFEQLILLNDQRDVLYKQGEIGERGEKFLQEALAAGRSSTFFEDKKQIVIVNEQMSEGWTQAAYISKPLLFQKIRAILLYYFLIIITSLLAVQLLMLPLIVNITRPISRLAGAMKRLAVGDLKAQVQIRSGDEMEILGNGFNRMAIQLRENMESSIQQEQLKRKFQVDLLMSQINPHFIYNTLNTIIYLSYAERSRDAAEMTQALIGILQDTIKTGDGAVTARLQEELKIVEKYAFIQQKRYPDRFKLDLRIGEELWDALIPRMTLQPLVENALFHGIVPTDGSEGVITLQAQVSGQQLVISVMDNGCGMTDFQLEQLTLQLETPRDSTKEGGVAIRNIRDRIHFFYGEEYGLSIASKAGEGTTVSMKLPLQRS